MANADSKAGRAAKAGVEKTASPTEKNSAARTGKFADAAFAYPKFEVPETIRSFVEQGLAQTRDAYANMKATAEETTDILEDGFETARERAREVQSKGLDLAKANADATFDLFRKLLVTSSVSDAVQLQAAFARERFEAFVDYSKDMQGTLSRAGAEAAKPAQTLFDRTVNFGKAA